MGGDGFRSGARGAAGRRRAGLGRGAGARAALGLVALGLGGCSPGIKWRGYAFEPVFAESRAAGRLTFVYFRSHLSPRCTNFEEKVLKQPRVLEATAELFCVPLNFDWDQALAQRWGIRQVPGFVIVDPQQRVLARGQGQITAEELLAAIRQAREQFAPRTQPAGPP